ncbi:MAG: stalk domain-containing protein [Thermincola sp.]|jgi:alpha-tubulin suppressor-like RCC1 family protein|nr:stalk domain-containing protein [Thermincola sp.]MDT3704117.1 stalk domain-containing protein [Thermincola sp.]
MKKVLSFLLVTVMLFTMQGIPVFADNTMQGNGIKAIAVGPLHNLVIKKDGSLWAWGVNNRGQLGDGTEVDKTTPVKIMDKVRSISAGGIYSWPQYGGYSLAVKEDGTLWAWGDAGDLGNGVVTTGQISPLKIMDDVKTVAAEGHIAAIRGDDSLWVWGVDQSKPIKFNPNLPLGTVSYAPVKMMEGVKAVSSGYSAVYAIKKDGSLWSVGVNGLHKETPVKILDGVKAVSAGLRHCLAIKEDGSLWSWGENYYGQLGDGTNGANEGKKTPVRIMDGVKAIFAGYNQSFAVKEDGSLWAWGYNNAGQLGDGTFKDRYRPVKVGDGFVTVSTGEYQTLAVKEDGSLWAWGDNNNNLLGVGKMKIVINKPEKISDDIEGISAGRTHSLITKKDGSLWACGDNKDNQLGDGSGEGGGFGHGADSGVLIKIMDGVTSFAAGGNFSLAVKNDNSLWTWGERYVGASVISNYATPIKIKADVKEVSAGYNYGFAIQNDRSLWAWGANHYGTLGDGTTTDRAEPVKIMDGVKAVSAGVIHSFAIKEDGSLWAWGRNDYGQLGDGTTSDKNKPVKIMDKVKDVSAGGSCGYAIKEDGSLWAWGYNYYGQLGNGTTSENHKPVKIMDKVKDVSAGGSSGYAIKEDGSLWAWGFNGYGQLGDGTTVDKHKPVKIMEKVKLVSAGQSHCLAVKEDSSLWSWGRLGDGQLGNGLTTNINQPMKVVIFSSSTNMAISALPTNSKILVNGKSISFEAYNINGNNYFKLRDLAMAVNGTEKQFEVGWDGTKNAISLTTNKVYTSAGGELSVSANPTSKEAKPTTSKIFLNGQEVSLTAYNINGYNYFKLRDVGKAINFGVTWDGRTNTIGIDTSAVYTE